MRPNTKVLPETASQTAGPYVHIGLAPKAAGFEIYAQEAGEDIAGPNAAGQRIRIEGVVWDGDAEPVKDVLLEVWQANAEGHFANRDPVEEGFRGWGRIICDFDTGEWSFDTVKPGAFGQEAPYISLWIVARGINIGLNTRLYFPEDAQAHARDPVLTAIHPDLRATLVATKSNTEGPAAYRFDIHLQGERETVFFDI